MAGKGADNSDAAESSVDEQSENNDDGRSASRGKTPCIHKHIYIYSSETDEFW